MQQAVRVRFAPSPTGFLHVGGARTALYNWLFARQRGGVFVLRIEDTDRERSSGEMTEAILHGMRWLGLEWDEGPYHQADGLARHRADALRVLERGRAYRCFCTPEQLQARRAAAPVPEGWRYDRACLAFSAEDAARRADAGEPFTIRFHVPEGATEWDDAVHGPTRFRNEDIEDFIVLRSDATPIYNLAVVSDDIEMRITHVIRGDDHLSNTPKQILLYAALGAPMPTFAHLPMILGPDGRRLSKRHGATAVGEYEQRGILPDALVNFLALLGWNAGDDVEIMTRAEMIERFSLERINKKSAVFDTEKLEWMNGRYLAEVEAAAILPRLREEWRAAGWLDDAAPVLDETALLALTDLLKTRGRTLPEVARLARPYLTDEISYDPDAVAKHWRNVDEASARLRAAREALAALAQWMPEAIDATLRGAAAEAGVGFGKLVHPLRLALVGSSASPGIDAVVHLLGRARVLARIDAALDWLAARNEMIDSAERGA